MEEERKQELCEQLHTVDTSLVFLVVVILSVCLSWWGTAIQRRGLCDILLGETETVPDVFPIRATASALIIGALAYFFGLAADTWWESRAQDWAARCSADRNLWAALLVLAAALIRLWDLFFVQNTQPALEEALLPD